MAVSPRGPLGFVVFAGLKSNRILRGFHEIILPVSTLGTSFPPSLSSSFSGDDFSSSKSWGVLHNSLRLNLRENGRCLLVTFLIQMIHNPKGRFDPLLHCRQDSTYSV